MFHKFLGKEIELFLNGEEPILTENISLKNEIFSVNGSYNYLKKNNLPIDYFSGDLDSLNKNYRKKIHVKKHIYDTSHNQDYTDFEKALNIIHNNGFFNVNVWGGSGKEQDHFLGNLSSALKYKKKLSIIFYDKYHIFFFVEKNFSFYIEKNKKISLFPFPKVLELEISGTKYPVYKKNMEIGKKIGIRNQSICKKINIKYKKGNLLIFIQR